MLRCATRLLLQRYGYAHTISEDSELCSKMFFWQFIVNNRNTPGLKEGHCILFFRPRTHPKTFLQCFALEQRKYKAKHCRNILGLVLGRKNKIQIRSLYEHETLGPQK